MTEASRGSGLVPGISRPAEHMLPTVCILAGGLGTRLGPLVEDTPKPLLRVADKPFLLHQLLLLASAGASRVVLCVGHLGERIEGAIGRTQFGLTIDYSYDGPTLAGTLGAVRHAADLLGERFLVLYGDTYLRVNYQAFASQWLGSGLAGAMSVLHNRDSWDRSNVIYKDSRVIMYDKASSSPDMEWIDYGLGGLTAGTLRLCPADERDLSALYRELASRGQLYGFEATERFYEIGTPSALREADDYLRSLDRPGGAG